MEDVEIPTKTPATTHKEKTIETQPTQLIRGFPYPERLTLQKFVEQPQFNLLGELKNICVKIPLLQALHDVPIYAKTVGDLCVRNQAENPGILPLSMS